MFSKILLKKNVSAAKRGKVRFSLGFTLVEMLVTVSIFALMTTFLVFKYGTFNESIIVTNLAYDIALTIRQAQSYGINVYQSQNNTFSNSFGVHFSMANDTVRREFLFFPDVSLSDNRYTGTADEFAAKTLYRIKKGNYIFSLCAGASTCSPVTTLDIAYRRPEPGAVINNNTANTQAKIVVSSADGTFKKAIVVRRTGQISIEEQL